VTGSRVSVNLVRPQFVFVKMAVCGGPTPFLPCYNHRTVWLSSQEYLICATYAVSV
jgi:hypothetical protein